MLLVLVGLPGAGKTYLARRLVARGNWRHVSQDELGSRRACEEECVRALRQGWNVVVDRCNFDEQQRSHWVQLARSCRSGPAMQLVAVQLLLPLDLCRERARGRTEHPTLGPHNCDEVISRFAADFVHVRPGEGFQRVITVHSSTEAEVQIEALAAEADAAVMAGDPAAGRRPALNSVAGAAAYSGAGGGGGGEYSYGGGGGGSGGGWQGGDLRSGWHGQPAPQQWSQGHGVYDPRSGYGRRGGYGGRGSYGECGTYGGRGGLWGDRGGYAGYGGHSGQGSHTAAAFASVQSSQHGSGHSSKSNGRSNDLHSSGQESSRNANGHANGRGSDGRGGGSRGRQGGRGRGDARSGSHKAIEAELRAQFANPSSTVPYDTPAHPGITPDPRPVLLFDLNGTLTSHTSVRRASGTTRLRPGAGELLRRLQPHFRLGIYTSSTPRTVNTALQLLEADAAAAATGGLAAAGGGGASAAVPQVFERALILHREHTEPVPNAHVAGGGDPWDTLKPLARYFGRLHRLALVDDDAYKALPGESSNMLLLPCWRHEDPGCRVLQRLGDLLLQLVAGLPADADVRPHMAAISEQLRQEAAEGGAQQQGAEGEEEEEESGEEESGEEEDAFPPGPEYGAGQAVGEGAQQLKGGGR
ncbi:hypothetical protein CHLRE_02g079150v5 [Chlamydomonas reinhardtii]|uniref:FCP1 homology domain-containing protein n=1 Tax=Chlamydomonas reinhardtii TaxID=3055 RepID=A0A2K3E0F4_CHLRE|nr:uncharacterized protein CHLRE_02g079150v5 [Chlamydomonas reinhardtii]PNW86266.1 hypothetical protein CHLRE_02g079150v5 [Chlamydomonas reinhardtii]